MPGPVVFNQAYYKTNEHVPQHVTVNVGNQELGRVGGNMSSRMVLTVEDEAGRKVKGFFTENEYNSFSAMFASRFHPTLEKPGNEAYRPIFDTLKRKGILKYSNEKLKEMFQAFGTPLPKNIDEAKEFLAKVKNHSNFNNDPRLDDNEKGAMLTWLNNNALVSMEELTEMAKNESFWNYLGEMMYSVSAATATVSTHVNKDLHAQSLGGNINKRNNAMYDYAALLGEPDLLAKSSSMTLADGDKKLHGTFMVNAKGIERKALYSVASSNRRDLLITGSGLRDISKLQIFDFLCGNFDRHYDNWFYQYEEINQEVRITGVQGIDNDASFGAVQHKGEGVQGYMSRLDDIKVIDKKLADNILSAGFEKIEERLRLAELSTDEIDAARERFSGLQERLRSGKIEIVNGLDAWDQKMAYDPNMENLRYLGNDNSANIFQLAWEACNNYDSHKIYQAPAVPQAPVGNATEIVESGSLGNQIDRFTAMQKNLAAVKGEDIAPVKGKLAAVLDTLKSNAGKDFLNDMERNFLSEQLKDLSDVSETYAKEHETDAKSSSKTLRSGLNDVKNLAAFARFSRESVRQDALEQEKNAASYQAEKIARKNSIQHTASFSSADDIRALNTTYADLKKGLSSVDSAFIKSSTEFKDMMDAFNALKDAPDKNDALAQISYQAQRYIDYKTKPPKGKTTAPKLSDYAKKRVEYARRILDFSFKAAEHIKPDYRKQAEELVRFNNQCAKLINDFSNALHTKNDEKIQQAKEAILGAGEFFMDGCQKMVAASSSYSLDHSMQLLCHSLLTDQPGHKSSINALAIVHANLINEQNGVDRKAENAAKPYASLGVSRLAINNLKTRLENSPAVTQPRPQAATQPQKDAKKEKVANVLGG